MTKLTFYNTSEYFGCNFYDCVKIELYFSTNFPLTNSSEYLDFSTISMGN